jgi:hypothetical protein
MGSPVQRSIRLIGKNASSLDRLIGEPGEIFLDNDTQTLRIFTGHNTGGYSIASEAWVASSLSNFDGEISATKLIGDLYAANRTSKILENGTDGTDAVFTGDVVGDVSGNAGTVTNGVYTTGSYADPTWISSLASSKITGTIHANTVTNGVYVTDTGTVTNTMLAGNIANNKLANSSITLGSTNLALGSTTTAISGLTSVSSTAFTGNLTGNVTGNASTATKFATARNINGVAFDGSVDVTVTAAAGTLSGTTINSTVVTSSLTSVGTLNELSVEGELSVNNSIAATGDITTDSNVVVSTLPTTSAHATNKQYVDTRSIAMSIAMS